MRAHRRWWRRSRVLECWVEDVTLDSPTLSPDGRQFLLRETDGMRCRSAESLAVLLGLADEASKRRSRERALVPPFAHLGAGLAIAREGETGELRFLGLAPMRVGPRVALDTSALPGFAEALARRGAVHEASLLSTSPAGRFLTLHVLRTARSVRNWVASWRLK